jgi:catalase
MSDPEQRHIVSAFSFELGKVGMFAIRRRVLGQLAIIIEAELYKRVAEALGMERQAERIQPARQPIDLKPSPAPEPCAEGARTLVGCTIAILVSNAIFFDTAVLALSPESARLLAHEAAAIGHLKVIGLTAAALRRSSRPPVSIPTWT